MLEQSNSMKTFARETTKCFDYCNKVMKYTTVESKDR